MEAPPIVWSDERLEADRKTAVEQFRETRLSEDLEEYQALCKKYYNLTSKVLDQTDDLRNIDLETATHILIDDERLYVFRYLTGPPISKDDLETLSSASLAPTKLRDNREGVREIVETVYSALDPMRFPWIEENRDPTDAEVDEAVLATAEMIAMRRMGTRRRMGASSRQENKVESVLQNSGLEKVSSRDIYDISSAPETGKFCRESVVLDRKADFIARLWDERLLLIECKVSNSHVNSIKRLNREAVPKGLYWKEELEEQVVSASVLDGVFNLKNLKEAQNDGILLFWEHSLNELAAWIEGMK